LTLARDNELKKQLVCNKLIHDLIELCVFSCNEKTIAYYDEKIGRGSLKCLESLSGIDTRKLYIPGETKEISKFRYFFISQGGVASVWIISQFSQDAELKKMAVEGLLNNLSYKDWMTQLNAVKTLKSRMDDPNKSRQEQSKINLKS
jgi:hypothetical protein